MDKEKNNKNDYYPVIWRIMATSTVWIVVPVIIGFLLGKLLDKKFNTEPWLLLLTLGICFVCSMVGLTINALKEVKKMDDDKREKDKNKSEH